MIGCMVAEEGPRFDAAIFGSRMLCGEPDIDSLLARVDRDGLSLPRAVRPCAASRRRVARGEAPTWLEQVGLWLGCTSIRESRSSTYPPPWAWQGGSRASAGARRSGARRTTPGRPRWPAAATRSSHAARTVVAAEPPPQGEPGAVATVGRVEARPGAAQRDPRKRLHDHARRPGARRGSASSRARWGVRRREGDGRRVGVSWSRESADAGSLFDGELRATLARAAAAAGVAASDLWAYAGHDAGVLARHVPAAHAVRTEPDRRLAPPRRVLVRGRLPGRLPRARGGARRPRKKKK